MSTRLRKRRSDCPISFALDLLGDRWTLLVIRDLVFGRKRHFKDFLASPEGIASNILAARLKLLTGAGLVTRRPDAKSGRELVYELTERGVDLVPVLVELIRWGAKHDAKTAAPAAFVRRVEDDREGLVAELRSSLVGATGTPPKRTRPRKK